MITWWSKEQQSRPSCANSIPPKYVGIFPRPKNEFHECLLHASHASNFRKHSSSRRRRRYCCSCWCWYTCSYLIKNRRSRTIPNILGLKGPTGAFLQETNEPMNEGQRRLLLQRSRKRQNVCITKCRRQLNIWYSQNKDFRE